MKDKRPLIIFGIAFLLLLLVFFFIKGAGPRFNWSETYKSGSKDPYGTYIVHQLLNDYFPSHKLEDIASSVSSELPIPEEDERANYVFVGEGLYMDTSDVDQLLAFVEKGNNAFISSKSIPYDLMFFVYYEECNDYLWDDYKAVSDTSVMMNMQHSNLRDSTGQMFKFVRKNTTQNYKWHYIDSVYFCEEDYSFVSLGTVNNRYVNFAKKKYGEGYFYFHTNPIAFSNIQLLDEVGISYMDKVFSHMHDGPIFWDKYSRVRESTSRRRNQMQQYNPERELNTEGPLSYIMGEPPLRTAWYILLACTVLYLIFRAKRNQRIIPVYEGNKNTSLEFISTIGSLYFIQNDHRKLCLQKMKLFLAHIRNRYGMSTKVIDSTFLKRLSVKSEIPENQIEQIVSFYNNIKNGSFVSDQSLIEFHQKLEHFYKNRK